MSEIELKLKEYIKKPYMVFVDSLLFGIRIIIATYVLRIILSLNNSEADFRIYLAYLVIISLAAH